MTEAERDHARLIEHNLCTLGRLTRQFRSALELMQHSMHLRDDIFGNRRSLRDEASVTDLWLDSGHRERLNDMLDQSDTYSEWAHTAVARGALLLYGFQEVIQSINKLIGHAPTVRGKVDFDIRKQAQTLFTTAFPAISSVRLSAAHPGEFGSKKGDYEKHAVRGPVESPGLLKIDGPSTAQLNDVLFVSDTGCTLTSTINGQIVSYTLSEDSLHALSICTMLYWKAFSSAESAFFGTQGTQESQVSGGLI